MLIGSLYSEARLAVFSGLVRGTDVAGVGVDAVLAVQAEGGDLDLERGPVGSLEFQVSPVKNPYCSKKKPDGWSTF